MEFSDDFLKEVGLSVMPDDEKQAFLEYVQEELEVRVGEEIADGLSVEKMKEFEAAKTSDETEKWLQENKPNYADIVKREIAELKDEIARNRDKIL